MLIPQEAIHNIEVVGDRVEVGFVEGECEEVGGYVGLFDIVGRKEDVGLEVGQDQRSNGVG